MTLTDKELEEIASQAADIVCPLNVPKPAEKSEERDPYKDLKPMKEWMQAKIDSGSPECKPCLLGPVANWYYSELQEQGVEDQAKKLEDKVESLVEDDPKAVLALCETFDEIKSQVNKKLRARLEDFDVEIQSFTEEDLKALADEAKTTEEEIAEPSDELSPSDV